MSAQSTRTGGGRGVRQARAVERRTQIIRATVQCLAVNGFGGTTLERIADTAGMARGHVRYFAGNRDELLAEAARVFYFGDLALRETDLTALAREAPMLAAGSDVGGMLDYLFGDFAAPGAENAAAQAFIDAGRAVPAVGQILTAAYAGLQASVEQSLLQGFPRSEPAARADVAYGVLSLALGNNLMGDVEGLQQRSSVARRTAELLVAQLDRAAVGG